MGLGALWVLLPVIAAQLAGEGAKGWIIASHEAFSEAFLAVVTWRRFRGMPRGALRSQAAALGIAFSALGISDLFYFLNTRLPEAYSRSLTYVTETGYTLFQACLLAALLGAARGANLRLKSVWPVLCAAGYAWLSYRYVLFPYYSRPNTPTGYFLVSSTLYAVLQVGVLTAVTAFAPRVNSGREHGFLQAVLLLCLSDFAIRYYDAVSPDARFIWAESGWQAAVAALAVQAWRSGRGAPLEFRSVAPVRSVRVMLTLAIVASNLALLGALLLTRIHGIGTAFHLTTVLLLAYGIWFVANEIGIRLSRRLHGVERLMAAHAPASPDGLGPVSERTGIHEIDAWLLAYNTVLGRLKGAIERLIQQAELVQTGKVSAQVAHDIRSPLAALNAAVASPAVPADERALIQAAAQRIRDIASDLLSKGASSASTGTRSVKLAELAQAAVNEKMLQYGGQPGLRIEYVAGDGATDAHAHVEPLRLGRALSNLIDNAVEAGDGPAQVAVRVERVGDLVRICVEDRGKGIPPEVLPRLARRGESWGKAGGQGLGLYSAREAVESWGGRLEIESRPGQGTRVWLAFPSS